ncbi:hypothetical protein D3C71_1351610 [compost metagenome]
MARSCFEKYHEGDNSRSREELIAEVGALLLASEAGLRSSGSDKSDFLEENSITYVANWCDWMKDNKNELVLGVFQAEKAKKYIMNIANSNKDLVDIEDDVDLTELDIVE